MAVDNPIIYGHTMEGLLNAIRSRATPRLVERLAAVGVSMTDKPRSSYSLSGYRDALRITREELYPLLPEAEGYRRLGEDFANGYVQTTFGGAVAAIIRMLGPKRMLGRATQQFRSGNNFTDTRLTELGPQHFELWVREPQQPDFTAGLIARGLAVAGAKDHRVEITQRDATKREYTYAIRWS